MRKLLVVAALLVTSSAFAEDVLVVPMDDPLFGWGCELSVVTEGDRTFTRAHNFNEDAGGWWYCNVFTGTVDISEAVRFEADVRWHQEGTYAYDNAYVALRLGSPGFGEYFEDPLFLVGSVPPDSVGDEWYRVGFDISLAAPEMDLTQFDGFEFFGAFGDDAPDLDYVDFDNVVFTPEPASLLLLGLGIVSVLRRR